MTMKSRTSLVATCAVAGWVRGSMFAVATRSGLADAPPRERRGARDGAADRGEPVGAPLAGTWPAPGGRAALSGRAGGGACVGVGGIVHVAKRVGEGAALVLDRHSVNVVRHGSGDGISHQVDELGLGNHLADALGSARVLGEARIAGGGLAAHLRVRGKQTLV